jgi:hypothetical protein
MIARDFLEFIQHTTDVENSTIMIIRTVGPDNATDVEKVNYIYSVYKTNFESENVDIFEKFMYNEFTFVEFESEEDAYEFALQNFPMKKTEDSDFFVQFFIFSDGNLAYANDSLVGLSSQIPQPNEPVE